MLFLSNRQSRFAGRRAGFPNTGDAGYEYPLTIQDETRDYEVRLAVSAPDEVVGIIRDITQRKEVERLKDDLVSTVSHELRTPATSLRGFTELLLTRAFSPEKQRDILFIMQREAERLTNLI